MPRSLTPAIALEFAKKNLLPVLLVEIQFVSGWVRLFSGFGSLTWNGQTWLGIGMPNGQLMGAISQLSESSDLTADGVTVSLTGIPPSAIQQALNEIRPSFPANIYLGAIDAVTMLPIPAPYCAWSGFTDVPTISDGGATATLSLSLESMLAELQRASVWYYTHEDQQVLSPGDNGFAFVGALQNFAMTWGSGTAAAPAPYVMVPRQ